MISKIKKHFENYLFFHIILFYFLITTFIWPFGEHSVNDDWQFLTHVRYFSEGNFVKNSLIDASFILQGLIGTFWVKIFGLSFINLRILTIIFTLIFLYGIYKITKFYNLNLTTKLLIFLSIFLEPLFLTSSYSFMTEIYFLTFSIWSFYFLITGLNDQKKELKYLIIGLILGSLTILIRQFGIVLFFAYLILIFFQIKENKKKYLYLLLSLVLFITTITTNFIFPQYSGNYESKVDKMSELIVNPKDIFEKVSQVLLYSTYLLFYLAPFLLSLKLKNHFLKIIALIFSFVLALPIFNIDIFNLKNVFHIECIYCETQFKHSTSLFDNIYFKYILSYILSFTAISSVLLIFENKSGFKFKFKKLFEPTLIISLGMFSVIFFVDSFYERYFINFAVFFIIYLGIKLNDQLKLNYLSFSISLLFLIIIIFLNFDFYRSVELKWSQSLKIREVTGREGEIFTIGSFYRYLNAQKTKIEDLKSSSYRGTHKCYVERYITGEDNQIVKFLNNNKVPKIGFVENPTFSNTGLQIKIPKINSFSNKLIDIKEYYSPIYNILGRRTFIVSFCEEEVTNNLNIEYKNIEIK